MLLSRSILSFLWLAAAGCLPRWRRLAFASLLLPLAPGAAAAPRVAVVDSAIATAWLRSAGVECLPVAAADLGTSMPDVPLIVLPLDRIRSGAVVPALTAYTAR